jgi:hypothetical protein
MDRRRSDALALQLEGAEQALWQSLAEVCAKAPPTRRNTGELIRVAAVLEIAGSDVRRAIAIRRRRRLERAARSDRVLMADAEAMMTRTTSRHAFIDSRGVGWSVFDVQPTLEPAMLSQLAPPFQEGWLCFESVAEKRRLSPIPSNWRSLSDSDLEHLLEQAEIVPVPRRRSRRSRDDLTPPPT